MAEESVETPVLKACPSCGSTEVSHGFEWPPMKGHVKCESCDVFVVANSEAEAISVWNHSPPDPYALAADALESLWHDGREDILCRDTMQWAIDHLRAMGAEKE